VHAQAERLQRLAQALHDQVKRWHLQPVVKALQALLGVPCTVAITRIAAVGDLTRVDTPRELMKCLGLIPSKYSSGERRRQGSITQAGHTHARRASWREPGPPALPRRAAAICTCALQHNRK